MEANSNETNTNNNQNGSRTNQTSDSASSAPSTPTTTPNESLTSSSQINLAENVASEEASQNRMQFRPPPPPPPSSLPLRNENESSTKQEPHTFSLYSGRDPLSTGLTSPTSYLSSPSSASSYSRQLSAFPSLYMYETLNANASMYEPAEEGSFSPKSCCIECGAYAQLVKCMSHCDLHICENCQHKHWQIEINELIKYKTSLENNVDELKKYLAAKRSQCTENIKNSQQIKKFINMTMQQIKRKVELELENKRDELYNSIDAFMENQKKISSSINEDTFQTSERICTQIENLLLNAENDLNIIKVKSLKTFAKAQLQKLNQQRASKIPLYSIFFVPDSSIQVNNSFGKIVLKSYDEANSADSRGEFDFDDNASQMSNDIYNRSNEFDFLNGHNHFDASQILTSLNGAYKQPSTNGSSNYSSLLSPRYSTENKFFSSKMDTPSPSVLGSNGISSSSSSNSLMRRRFFSPSVETTQKEKRSSLFENKMLDMAKVINGSPFDTPKSDHLAATNAEKVQPNPEPKSPSPLPATKANNEQQVDYLNEYVFARKPIIKINKSMRPNGSNGKEVNGNELKKQPQPPLFDEVNKLRQGKEGNQSIETTTGNNSNNKTNGPKEKYDAQQNSSNQTPPRMIRI